MCNCYCYWEGGNPSYIMVYRCLPRKPPMDLTSKASASSTAKSTLRGSWDGEVLRRAMFHLKSHILKRGWNEDPVFMRINFPSLDFSVHFPVTSRVGEAVRKLCSKSINPTIDIPIYLIHDVFSALFMYCTRHETNEIEPLTASYQGVESISFLANVSPHKMNWSSMYASNFFPFRECLRK